MFRTRWGVFILIRVIQRRRCHGQERCFRVDALRNWARLWWLARYFGSGLPCHRIARDHYHSNARSGIDQQINQRAIQDFGLSLQSLMMYIYIYNSFAVHIVWRGLFDLLILQLDRLSIHKYALSFVWLRFPPLSYYCGELHDDFFFWSL